MAEIFRSAFTEAQLIDNASTTLVAGTFIKVGEYKVEAGEVITIGYGEQSGQNNAQGRIFISLKDTTATPVQIHGTIRLQIYSPQNRPLRIMGEWRTETLLSGETDRALMIPLPENSSWLSEDKKLVMEVMADSNATLSKTNSNLIMDMTIEAV